MICFISLRALEAPTQTETDSMSETGSGPDESRDPDDDANGLFYLLTARTEGRHCERSNGQQTDPHYAGPSPPAERGGGGLEPGHWLRRRWSNTPMVNGAVVRSHKTSMSSET